MSGANYFKHVVDIIVDLGPGKTPGTDGMDPQQLRSYAEALMRRRQTEGEPYIFSKPVSVLSGAFDPIVVPGVARQPDWELELAVVIGRPARHVNKADALGYVAGYTVANDITNRDWVWAKPDMKAMGTDWIAAKCSPTYLPVGPYIVPASHVTNPQDLQVQLKLNGQTMQDESTADMIFDVARLVEHVSSRVQLLPGDLICTGSPAGNGTHYGRFLQPGDIVEGSITGLGTQRNSVVAESN
jgi:2-keto-4-pentenoate hydratase/2-oxohepta-3-ene-1,7-dioic acid hydratase in catechol pathway